MNLLHITDLHFGPYHWLADDTQVIERLNAFPADIVINTGDLTSDSLPVEFQECQTFLSQLKCKNVVSIMGNHDKYSKRSHEMFREYIYDGQFITPKDPIKIKKPNVFFEPARMKLKDYLTEVNFLQVIKAGEQTVLLICIDTNVFQSDAGHVEEQILQSIADEISGLNYDRILMLSHHPVLATDEDPMYNSKRVTEFILKHKIEAVFCGHTHELDILDVSDVVGGSRFRQFMCGSMSSVNISRESNMFCTYENFGTPEEVITVTRMYPTKTGLEFVETRIGT